MTCLSIISAGLSVTVIPTEEARKILGILETLLDYRCGIGVILDVLPEPAVIVQDVVDEAAEKCHVAAGPNPNKDIAQCGRAGETRVDVDQGGAFLLGLHGPAETNRMGLGHVRPHEQDAVTVCEVLLIVGSRAAAKRGAQTGHRCAMSYPRLILNRYYS